jgi:chorismate mutase/prephenate dehydratase
MISVAYLGPENTNTHAAARKRFGNRSTYVHAPTIEDVFYLVEREEVTYGVVPIENSLGGAVTHTLDRFVDFKHSPVNIVGEIELPIRHFLIYPKQLQRAQIKTIYSHPQALTQCHRWLERMLPQVELNETRSTAEAVRLLLEAGDGRTRAIAAIGPAESIDSSKLASEEIPQNRENKTRFLLLGLGEARRGKRNKTAVMFALKDKPGALYDALAPFKRHHINLTKIESHPNKRRAWEYVFFIDVEGHVQDEPVKQALSAVEGDSVLFRVLGSYPIKASRS